MDFPQINKWINIYHDFCFKSELMFVVWSYVSSEVIELLFSRIKISKCVRNYNKIIIDILMKTKKTTKKK